MKLNKYMLTATLIAGLGLATGTGVLAAEMNKNMLSRDALRLCMAQNHKIESLNTEISKSQATLETEAKAIDKMERKLNYDKMSLDNSNSIAVELFNARVEERDAMIASHNVKIESLNKKAAELNAENDRYVSQCAGKDYDEADKTAILSGK